MKYERMGFYWLLLTAVLSVCLSNPSVTAAQEETADKEKPLPKKLVRTVEQQLIPIIKAGNEEAFLQLSMPLIESSKPERLQAIDQLCLDHDAATVSSWFTDLVIEKTQQGINPSHATSNIQMAKVVLYNIVDQLEQFEESLAEHVVQQEPLLVPVDFQESEELFWDIHVLHNEFDNVTHKLQLARALLMQHQKALQKQDEGEALVTQYAAIESRLQDQYNNIRERAADLRLQRFQAAHELLVAKDSQDDFELLLTSAMALEQDGQVLAGFLTGNESISRESLKGANLLDDVSTMLTSGRKAGGDVTEKANLFRNGLHYWVRGRYGAGPLTGGLVKTKQAVGSLQAMEMLSMPKVRDKPISNFHSDNESTPGFDRRHYYSWAAEYRRFSRAPQTASSSSRILDTSVGGIKQEKSQRFI